MAKTTLRAYSQEIELMVNQNRTDEAIVHCKHILNTFSKHIDTYRLLGKAFLEANRYSDAIDIFQRVLSAVPDDFVAHLGMSIIKEDEGNLDSALWHMERAYENQPYNSAIIEELKRLFEKRDGAAPMKVRLTRGALARMYAKGDLYQQAIAELRIELSKDPDRLDLQVLLARMLVGSGKKVEAAEISSQILKKLPYCLDANRILAKVLQSSDRIDDALTIQKRLAALDPYEAFVSQDAPTAERVNDTAVTLERLDLQSTDIATIGKTSSEWMSSLGIQAVEMEDQDNNLPDWLVKASEARETSAPEAPFIPEETPLAEFSENVEDTDWIGAIDASANAEPLPEDEIPEWMKNSGWSVSAGEIDQAESYLTEEEISTETPDTELSPGDLPPWLKDIAPEGALDEMQTEEDAELASLFGAPEEFSAHVEPESPAWIEESADGQENLEQTEEIFSEMKSEDENPQVEVEWSQLEGHIEAESLEILPSEEGELPDWLRNLGSSESVITTPTSMESTSDTELEDLPDWLKEFDDKAEKTGGDDLSQEPTPSLESFLETSTAIPVPDIEPEETGWVNEFEIEQDLTGSLPVEDEFPSDDLQEEPFTDMVFNEMDTETGTAPTLQVEAPDWFAELIDQPEEEQALAEAPDIELHPQGDQFPETNLPIEEELVASLGDLMDEVAEPTVTPDLSAMVTQSLDQTEAELSQSETIADISELSPLEADESLAGVELETPPDFEDMDAAIAWLEKLAASQGLSEGTAEDLLPAEDDSAEEPGLIFDSDTAEEADVAPVSTSETKLLDTELAGYEVEAEKPESPEDLGISESIDTKAPAAPVQAEIELESPPDFEDMDAAMAWLENLAAKHGGVDEQPAPELPQEPETVSEWDAESSGETDGILEPEFEAEDKPGEDLPIPDWLQDEIEPSPTEAEIVEQISSLPADETEEIPFPHISPISEPERAEQPSVGFEAEQPDSEQTTIAAPRIPISGETTIKPARLLESARQESMSGNVDTALAEYQQLIQDEHLVYEVVFDLRQLLNEHPDNFELWQTLGDAYLHNGQLQEALEAYSRAEELL